MFVSGNCLTSRPMFCSVNVLAMPVLEILKPPEAVIMWQKPTAIEMSCGCEINMYAPAEGDRPLF